MILEFTVNLPRGQATIQLLDIYIPDENTLEFGYRTFILDPEDESEYEVMQLTDLEHETIYKAILADLEHICG